MDYQTLKALYDQQNKQYIDSLGGGVGELYDPNHSFQTPDGGMLTASNGGLMYAAPDQGKGGVNTTYYADGTTKDGINATHHDFMDHIANLLPTVVPALIGAGTVAGAMGGLGAGAGASASAIPDAATLEAGGFGSGGMGLTGPGGIGSAGSLAGQGIAGGGAGSAAAAANAGLLGADQGLNEWSKLLGQNSADPGSILNTGLPTQATDPSSMGGLLDQLLNKLQSQLPGKLGSSLLQNLLGSALSGGKPAAQGGLSQASGVPMPTLDYSHMATQSNWNPLQWQSPHSDNVVGLPHQQG